MGGTHVLCTCTAVWRQHCNWNNRWWSVNKSTLLFLSWNDGIMAFCGLKIKRKDIIERDCDAGEAKSKDKQGGINEKYYLAEVIGNLESPGKCYCIVCDTEIKYSTRGFPALRDHCVKSSKLKDKIKLIKSNYRLDFYPKTGEKIPLIFFKLSNLAQLECHPQ